MRFVLVDRILALTPGDAIHAMMTLPASDEIFVDHFPGFPVVPGVLLIEMMAQAAGQCLDAEDFARGKAMLVQVRHAAFRQWIGPDQPVHIHARITASSPTYAAAACRLALTETESAIITVAEADLVFAFIPYSRLSRGYADRVLADYLESIRAREPRQ